MVIILKEKRTGQIDYHEPEDMNEILMSALEDMYAYPHLFLIFTEIVKALPFIKCVLLGVLFEHTHHALSRVSNVLPIAPKTGLPRTMSERNGRKRFRNMTDVMPIKIQPIGNPCGEVPTSGGFSFTKSLRFVWDVPVSYFTTHPAAMHM